MLHSFIKYLLRNQIIFALFLVFFGWFVVQIKDIIVSIFLSYIIMAAVLPAVEFLEKKIDDMTAMLPPMKSFILPGGHMTVSSIHITRCVCRRAERLAVNMQQSGVNVDDLVIRYLNRLSDYLFTLARFVGVKIGVEEIKWKPRV